MKIEDFRRVNNSEMKVNVHFSRNCMSYFINSLSANEIVISSDILEKCHEAIEQIERSDMANTIYLNVIGSHSFLSDIPSESSDCFFKIQTNKGLDYHNCEITLYVR